LIVNPAKPWSDLVVLQDLVAHLRQSWLPREIFRMAVGKDWLRLNLVGEQRPGLVLSTGSGTNLAFPVQGPWPEPVRNALPMAKGHILGQTLTGARLTGLGVLPSDRVLALRLQTTDGQTLHLLHQLFGARGNTTLIDQENQLLWSQHPTNHDLLTSLPPKATWETGNPDRAQEWVDDLSGLMVATFLDRLVQGVFTTHQSAISKSSRTTDRLVVNLRRDLDNADRQDEFRRTAEALAANLHSLKRGQATAEIQDLQDGSPLSVPMDPALTPAANMESWFRKARKAEKGRDIIAQNLADSLELQTAQQKANAELETIGKMEGELEKLAALHQWGQTHIKILPPARAAKKQRTQNADEPARLFRRFLIDEKWEAWVGRNNKENDLLTHRASHTRDIWLHAQGVSGSHVILRTAGQPELVPKTVLEKAAGLAALHSKAKHSALVPVIYTERRYVRKRRKAPMGTAVCLREKNLFIEPGVAPGVQPI
jgi:predicted ribosome quality control (RQC) complex YloA/Tae2 family protein